MPAEVVTKRLKNNKAPGVCNILPGMLKYGGVSVHAALYRVILGIWRIEQAPQDFKQDKLLPIPKKGDASLCSHYHTIALQSIPGKAYANVLSARLSEWLADNLLDEQCGFRPSRSTVDALFSLHLLCNGGLDKGQTLYAGPDQSL